MTNNLSQQIVVTLDNTAATRKYPFTQRTLDQIKDIRHSMEKEMHDTDGKDYLVPAPVVIAEAIENLHEKMFP